MAACTLSDGSTLSNFRAAGTTSGEASVPSNYTSGTDATGTISGYTGIRLGPANFLTTLGVGAIQLQYGYNLAAVTGKNWRSVVNSLMGNVIASALPAAESRRRPLPRIVGIPLTTNYQDLYVCASGVFTGFPAFGAVHQPEVVPGL